MKTTRRRQCVPEVANEHITSRQVEQPHQTTMQQWQTVLRCLQTCLIKRKCQAQSKRLAIRLPNYA